MRKLLTSGMAVMALGMALAEEPPKEKEEGVGLTVYNQGFAVVKVRRKLGLQAGVQDLLFKDVAATIDPTSVKFESLSDPEGTRVLEQNYQYDLVNQQKLLQKYVDREVGFERLNEKDKTWERSKGVLLSPQGIVQMAGEIRLSFPGSVILPALPEGLITRPTLQWKLDAKKGGEHLAKVTYQAGGIGWEAAYTLVAKQDDTLADLSGWVTINNQSGATYTDARIKLMAGDVHRVHEERKSKNAPGGKSGRLSEELGFQEKAFAEYHLYTLQRPATVKESEIKQLELLGAIDIPTRKLYRYDANLDEKKVRVLLGIQNRKADHLGMPLPAGKVRVYKEDEADKSLEFIGEDRIDHTPQDEKLELYVGDAFDLVAERIHNNTRKSGNHYWQSFTVKLRNHKETGPVTIEIVEHPGYGVNWEVEKHSDPFVKKDAGTLTFTVEVPQKGEKAVEYTLHSWSE